MCCHYALKILLFQRWARAYRDDDYHCAVNTNNGVEAQNRLLKHTYLTKQKNLTLSSLLCILVEHFLPDMYEKYVSAQFKMTTSYRQYYSWVPDFLHNRPRSVITHSLQRIKNCEKDNYCESDITTLDEDKGQFAIKCMSGRVCTLCFGNSSEAPSCSCEDWTKYHLPCKHFFAVFHFKKNWTWNQLPENYLNSPRLACDKSVLNSKEETISIQELTDLQFFDVTPNDPSGELLLGTEEADSKPDTHDEVS